MRTCPEACFGLVEAQCLLCEVAYEKLSYYLVLGVFPDATVRTVTDLVAAVTPPADSYQRLKRCLVSGPSLTEFQWRRCFRFSPWELSIQLSCLCI